MLRSAPCTCTLQVSQRYYIIDQKKGTDSDKQAVESSYKKAHELKFIIFDLEKDFALAEEHAKLVGDDCLLYLQSEWSQYVHNIKPIVEYVKNNPKWNISLQAHKFMHIP